MHVNKVRQAKKISCQAMHEHTASPKCRDISELQRGVAWPREASSLPIDKGGQVRVGSHWHILYVDIPHCS